MTRCDRAGGFTLLEALLALTLLAAALLPLFAVQQAATRAAAAVERAQARAELDRAILARLRSVNLPFKDKAIDGEFRIGSDRIFWRAEPVLPARRASAAETGQAGRFRVQLVRITVSIMGQAGQRRTWQVDHVVWVPLSPIRAGL
ncbi:hypothetical protein CCR80_08165 [Rhodothalassium salexigens]|uniref:prepilin-type N-terminal cleavage/methylation domain-containing protein n=1 Tax=Rhodothalassium salexigens TaxID=1086 RepID=UPI0019140F74|nr:prepilin-type N-terminal cleavage/methylation domain-containing protein [Rhodothalassium salexigens]MBK5921004.1 hypothetical protein [Rhodothalassium salexigens]